MRMGRWEWIILCHLSLAAICRGSAASVLGSSQRALHPSIAVSRPSRTLYRTLGDSTTIYKETFALPHFTYHMVVVDKDVELDALRFHLVAITKAHIRAALSHAEASSPVLERIRIEDLRLSAELHHAFTGENRDSGQPEAVIKCVFTGELVLTNHGSLDGKSQKERAGLQQREISEAVGAALKDADALYGRLGADKSLPTIEKFSVHVHTDDDQRTEIQKPHRSIAMSLAALVISCTFLLSISLVVRRRIARQKVRDVRKRLNHCNSQGLALECSSIPKVHDESVVVNRDALPEVL